MWEILADRESEANAEAERHRLRIDGHGAFLLSELCKVESERVGLQRFLILERAVPARSERELAVVETEHGESRADERRFEVAVERAAAAQIAAEREENLRAHEVGVTEFAALGESRCIVSAAHDAG